MAAAGTVCAGVGIYLVTLAVAAGGRQAAARPPSEPATRIAVLVPAHDESLLVGRCVGALLAQRYPPGLRRVIVVADNCTDDTAAIAAAEGAEVMIRTAPEARGKGQALRWAMDALVAASDAPQAFAVVDADSVPDPDLLGALAAEFEAGHEAVQADYAMSSGSPDAGEMSAIGFLLFHRVRLSGRHRLGMAANLVGNGMLLGSELLRRRPWGAFTSAEDLEYSIQLRLAGVKPRFAPGARVWGPGPASAAGAVRQRMRWEGGRFHIVRAMLPKLIGAAVARRDPGLLDAALDLATPPLGLLSLGVMSGMGVAAALASIGAVGWWAALPWAVAMAAVPAFVLIGLAAAGQPGTAWLVLRRAPGFLVWKAATYLRLARGFDVNRWDRTDRALP